LRGTVLFVSDSVAATDPQRAHPGFHFGVARMTGNTVADIARNPVANVSSYLSSVLNANDVPVAAAMLAWLRIGDHFFMRDSGRDEDNAKCVFLETLHDEKSQIYRPIDFDGAFGTRHWPEPGFSLPHVDEDHLLPPYMRGLDAELVKRELVKLGRINEIDSRACFGEMPEDWCPELSRRQAATWAVDRARVLANRGHFRQGTIVIEAA
jgi:hypothetical protein